MFRCQQKKKKKKKKNNWRKVKYIYLAKYFAAINSFRRQKYLLLDLFDGSSFSEVNGGKKSGEATLRREFCEFNEFVPDKLQRQRHLLLSSHRRRQYIL